MLRKARFSNEIGKDKTRIKHVFFMDDFKLFVKTQQGLESLVHTVRVMSTDVGMEFGTEKCAQLIIKKAK